MNPLMRRWSGRGARCDCRWLGSRLGYYLEGALGARAMVRANAHLDQCPGCQRAATLLEDSLKAARDFRPLRPGFDFEEAVWEKIRISREIQRQPGFWASFRESRLAWWGGGAVAFAGAAAVTFFVLVSGAPGPVMREATVTSPSSSPSGYHPSDQVAATPIHAPAGTAPAPDVARPEPAFVASAPQAGDETAPPAGPEETVASTQGPGRLEPGAPSGELYLEEVQLVPDPYTSDRTYVVRQAVVARPGSGSISF